MHPLADILYGQIHDINSNNLRNFRRIWFTIWGKLEKHGTWKKYILWSKVKVVDNTS